MVSIYIRNHIPESPIKAVRISVFSHREQCELIYHHGSKKQIPVQYFLNLGEQDFKHPLLQTRSAPIINGKYCIQYSDLDELASVGSRFYATIIRAGARASQIRIQYTGRAHEASRIRFSIDPNQVANETLNIPQFESFVRSQYNTPSFHWFQGILFDEVVDRCSLPKHIDADSLFDGTLFAKGWLKKTPPVECRFISDKMGLGVFARETIPANTPLFFYSGRLVSPSKEPISAYYFLTGYNCFKRNIDSVTDGCYSRFVNHAPTKSRVGCLSANLKVICLSYFGLSLIVYETVREIKNGEQLLVSYGPRYWRESKEALFPDSKKVTLVNHDGENIKNARMISRQTLYNMATNGVSKAQAKVFRRPLFFLALSLAIAYCLNHYY